nr:platelet glycoprotein V-like [Megalopta genalis]
MLSLRNNNIKLGETTFQELPALEMLDLSGNELAYLPKGWTNGLNKLKTLNLTSNRFTSLGNTRLIADFSNLMNLYLEENFIQKITDQELYSVPVNSTIYMHGFQHDYEDDPY